MINLCEDLINNYTPIILINFKVNKIHMTEKGNVNLFISLDIIIKDTW
jgi:hypothetical protein